MPALSFDDFRGGLWIPDEAAPVNEQAGFAVPANALLRADNVDFLPAGGVRGRRGSTLYSGTALPGPVVMVRKYYGRAVPSFQLGQAVGGVSDAIGSAEWENPAGLALPVDPSVATCDLIGSVQSKYLVAFAPFGPSPLPAGAVITGLLVQVTAKCAIASFAPTENSIRVFKAFAPVGGEQATSAALTTDFTTTAYGGPSDLWGTTLTAEEVNAAGFGVGISYEGGGGANVAAVAYVAVTIYYSAAEADALLVAHTAGSSLVYSRGTGSAFSAITGGTLADPLRRPRVVAWPQKGKLFLFDGVNPVSEYNGLEVVTTPTQTDSTGTLVYLPPRRGPYAALHKNRMYATDPGELAFSVYASDINNETAWRPELQLAVNDARGGQITGLESFGDALLIFKDTSLWRFVGDPEFSGSLVQLAQVGCVAPDSIAVTPFGVIFLSRDGLWLTDGDSLVPLSAPIRSLFVGRADQQVFTGAVGLYYPRRDQYWLHLDPAAGGPGYVLHRIAVPGGDGSEGQMLAWSRIPDLPMNAGAVLDGRSDEGELYLGDRSGLVWLRDTGSADFLSAYTTELVTAQVLIDRTRAMGRVNRLRPIFRGRGSLAMGLRYDQVDADDVTLNVGTTGAAPTIQEPRRFVTEMASFGRFLSLHAASTEGAEFEFHRCDADVRLRGGRVWR